MKRTNSFLLLFITLTFVTGSISTQAQIREFGNFATTGVDDAEELFTAYISPYLNGFGASMTGGWYNTAKTHKLGGFDLIISLNAAIVPEEYRSFNVDELNLTNIQRAEGTSETSSTIAGETENGPMMDYAYEDFDSSAFELPPGTGIPFVPSPMIQVGIGLIKGTDIMGRYMPQVGVEDKGKFGFWGIGLKHDIKQWIPVLKSTPVLNLSVMGGYTHLNSYVALHATPGDLNLEDYAAGIDPSTWDDQKLIASANSFTANLVVSANLPVVSFYGGVGFAYTKSNLKLEGNFPTITGITVENMQPVPLVEPQADVIDIEVENQDGGFTKPRLNIGVRFKMLKILMLNVDYTRANFDVVTFGLGITFR